MFKLEAKIGCSFLFYFLPIRLPPVFLDFTSPDANIQCQTSSFLKCPTQDFRDEDKYWFCLSHSQTRDQSTAVCYSKDKIILVVFSRSVSNLYATDVLFIPREITSLFAETMQNATFTLTDFSVKSLASQAIYLSERASSLDNTLLRQNHLQIDYVTVLNRRVTFRETFCLQRCFYVLLGQHSLATGSHCHQIHDKL